MSSAALPFEPPRPIDRKVSRLRLAVRLYVLVEGLAALAVVMGLAFWIGLAVDWFFEPRPALRVLMWGATATLAAAVAWRYILRRTFAALRSDSLALLVERKYPQLAEGLITVVEAAGDPHAGSVRRRMLDVSAERTVASLRDAPLHRVFDFRPLGTKVAAAVALWAAVFAFAAVQPTAFGFWLDRLRLSPELWPRLVQLTVVGFEEANADRTVNVARDDAYELQALASITDGHQAPAEVEVRWRTADGRRGRGPMLRIGEAQAGRDDAQLYRYTFKVGADIEFDVIGGDDRVRGLRLHPVDRPAVHGLAIHCEYPAYLRREPRLLPVSSGRVDLPEGARATCRGGSNKPLVEVRVHDPAEQVDLPARIPPENPLEFEFDLGQIGGDRVLMLTLHDADGVENRDPFRLLITAVADERPEVNVQLRGIGTAVTPQARIPFVGRLVDDYGLEEAWFEYIVNDGEPERRPLRTQPAGLADLRMTEAFDLAEAGSDAARTRLELEPGQRLTLSVQARDAYDLGDAPHVGGGSRLQLDVVTASQLRALLEKRELGLRQRFEAIYEKMAGVRDVIQRIDLAEGASDADDQGDAGPGDEAMSPERRRERDLARLSGLRQSATQLAFETTGVAEGFDDILAELVNNRVDTEELNERLARGISEPLKQIGGAMLPRFERRLGRLHTLLAAASAESDQAAQSLAAAHAEAQAIVDAMQAALDRMLELESYNELVELLRGIVGDQEALRDETLRLQREKLRELEE